MLRSLIHGLATIIMCVLLLVGTPGIAQAATLILSM
jgi:hypothetical protein